MQRAAADGRAARVGVGAAEHLQAGAVLRKAQRPARILDHAAEGAAGVAVAEDQRYGVLLAVLFTVPVPLRALIVVDWPLTSKVPGAQEETSPVPSPGGDGTAHAELQHAAADRGAARVAVGAGKHLRAAARLDEAQGRPVLWITPLKLPLASLLPTVRVAAMPAVLSTVPLPFRALADGVVAEEVQGAVADEDISAVGPAGQGRGGGQLERAAGTIVPPA